MQRARRDREAAEVAGLKRPRYAIPEDIGKALDELGLMEAYRSRPDYQQNDYIGWITRATRDDTRAHRLDQMLAELRSGTEYMGMPYAARKP